MHGVQSQSCKPTDETRGTTHHPSLLRTECTHTPYMRECGASVNVIRSCDRIHQGCPVSGLVRSADVYFHKRIAVRYKLATIAIRPIMKFKESADGVVVGSKYQINSNEIDIMNSCRSTFSSPIHVNSVWRQYDRCL